MDLERMAQKARRIIDQRGGSESVKEDAEELEQIATGEGSIVDRAKRAAAAIREPGAHHEQPAERGDDA
jgi:hypothetical protein